MGFYCHYFTPSWLSTTHQTHSLTLLFCKTFDNGSPVCNNGSKGPKQNKKPIKWLKIYMKNQKLDYISLANSWENLKQGRGRCAFQKKKKEKNELVMVGVTCNPSTLDQRQGQVELCEFKASLLYRMSFRTARAMERILGERKTERGRGGREGEWRLLTNWLRCFKWLSYTGHLDSMSQNRRHRLCKCKSSLKKTEEN